MVSNFILAVGSIALDYIELPDGRKGEVVGGSLTYFTLASAILASVHLVGIVGCDFPESGMSILKKAASNMDDLQQKQGTTFRWGGKYHEDKDYRTTLYTQLGVFEQFDPLLSEMNKLCPYVYLGNIQPSLQLRVLEQVTSPQWVVCDTMNLWIDTSREELLDVLTKTDIFLLNEEEATLLLDISDPVEAGQKILGMGPKAVIVKRGSQGVILVEKKRCVKVTVYPIRRVVDPTGAGDSFAGGFLGAFSQGKSMVESLLWGSATASFCIEGFGTKALENATLKKVSERVNCIRTKSNLP